MTPPRLLVIDRDSTINIASSNPASPFYRILCPAHFILRPNVITAFELIFALEVPFVIATKQRAIGEGKLSRKTLAEITRDMQRKLHPTQFIHIPFGETIVEESAENKSKLFAQIIENYSNESWVRENEKRLLVGNDFVPVQPHEICVIDDSEEECDVAAHLGMQTFRLVGHHDLYFAICSLFSLNP